MMTKRSFRLPLFSLIFSLVLMSLLAFAPKQIMKTSLRLTVLNELGNPVEGATVTLYNSEEDYRKGQNPEGEPQTTDKKGRAIFSKLEPKVYYIHAEKDDMTNVGVGVQTNELQSGRINKSNIIIE